MTNEEVIEILQQQKRDHAQLPQYIIEAIEIATSAIEKQIPKKPELYKHFKCGMYHNEYYCPNKCASYYEVFPSWKFCIHCGQALDWSDTE